MLTEGWGGVNRNFVKTNKISKDDLKAMKVYLAYIGDNVGKMGEWLAKYWVTNRKKIIGQVKSQAFSEFTSLFSYNHSNKAGLWPSQHKILEFIREYSELTNKKAISKTPPYNLLPDKLDGWLSMEAEKYYSKKKMKIPSGLKDGQDYEEVWHENGVQVWKIMTYEASEKIGAGCNWCVKRERDTWLQYVAEDDQAFYFIRNHRYNSDNNQYKLAVNVTSNDNIDSIWDKDDNQIGSRDNEIKEILDELKLPIKLFKHFRANDADEYEDDRRRELEEMAEHYDNFIEECEKWKKEKEDNQYDLNKEIEDNQEQRVGDLRDEMDEEDDEEKKEELEAEADRIEELDIEQYYEEFDGDYYGDYIWERSEPSWFPSADLALEDWWQEQGGHSSDEIREQISYYMLDGYTDLQLTNPNSWL